MTVDYISHHVKMMPLRGMSGFGGGAAGLYVKLESEVFWYGDRGLVFGGFYDGNESDSIDYMDITTPNNASNFGDLYQGVKFTCGTSSTASGKAFQVSGRKSGGSGTKRIEFITIATTGNSSNWGNLDINSDRTAAASNGTRALANNGWNVLGNVAYNSVEYFDATTSSNGQDFGNLSQAKYGCAACSDATRVLFGGGNNESGGQNDIDYFTIDTLSDSSDWGNLTNTKDYMGSCSNGTRGLWGGGNSSSKVIQYITFASTSDASSFGFLDVHEGVYGLCGLGNETRGIFAGGLDGNSVSTNIDYVAYDTAADATNFGSLNEGHYDSPGGSSGNAS